MNEMVKASDNLLNELLSNNGAFHVIMEKEVQSTEFGQVTFNFTIKNGKVDLSTLNIVKNKRYRYSGSTTGVD